MEEIQKGSARFGQILRAIRKENKIKQKEVAKLLGIAGNYLCMLEKDKKPFPSFKLMHKFSKLYQIPFEKLIFMISIKKLPNELTIKDIGLFEQSRDGLWLVLEYLSP